MSGDSGNYVGSAVWFLHLSFSTGRSPVAQLLLLPYHLFAYSYSNERVGFGSTGQKYILGNVQWLSLTISLIIEEDIDSLKD